MIGIVMRCIVVGIAYAILSSLSALALGPLSHLQPTPNTLLVWFISGTLMALVVAPFIVHSTGSKWEAVLAVWAAIAFVRSIGLGIEGSLFRPLGTQASMAGAISGIVIGFVFAWLAVSLLMTGIPAPQAEPATKRGPWGWAWRILLVGAAYFVFYFVFGAANALLYTRPFYENHPQYGLNLPPAGVIFLAELIRGPLFGLGAFFIFRSARLPQRQAGIWLGLVLYVLGGFGPYLETTFRSMPLGFNLATLLELFLQNFLTGVVAARVYR